MKTIKSNKCSAMFVCAFLNEVDKSPKKKTIKGGVFANGSRQAINHFHSLWGKSSEELDRITIDEMLDGVGDSMVEKRVIGQVRHIEQFYLSLYDALVDNNVPVAVNRPNVFAIAQKTNQENGILFGLELY